MANQAIPKDSPLDASAACCSQCGAMIQPTAIMGPRGVETLRYTCENPEKGCSYQFERKVFMQHINIRKVQKEETPKVA